MGSRVETKCLECEGEFLASHGGGFRFHQLRCCRCGKATAIRFDDLGDLHLRYLKGSERPYTVLDASAHEYVREHLDIEPMTVREYHAAVEKAAGKCDCGGPLSFDAPPRCPRCGSARLEEGRVVACFD